MQGNTASFTALRLLFRAAAEVKPHHDQIHLIIETFLFLLLIAKLLLSCMAISPSPQAPHTLITFKGGTRGPLGDK